MINSSNLNENYLLALHIHNKSTVPTNKNIIWTLPTAVVTKMAIRCTYEVE